VTVAQDSDAGTSGGSTPRGTRLPRSARRVQLLDAAREVFVSQGYHAAAMDDIAERAGVSKPVLYQHFPGKFELYLALLDEGTERLIETVREALESTSDNKLRVNATIAAYYDFVDGNGGAFRLVFESDLTSQAEVRDRVDSANRRCADLVTKVIAEDAGLSPHESHLLAVGLIGLAQVSARSWLDDDAPVDKETAVRLLSGLAWRGIGGFPRTT
jgi:AcrR family transcriptional regulator